jgi:hypothetical protein
MDHVPPFPDPQHHEHLRQKCETTKGLDLKLLTDDERWFWFAYKYGYKRAFLLNDERSLAIDPKGVLFNADLADKAAQMYRGQLRPKPQVLPADLAARNRDYERASRYREQDRKRDEFAAAVTTWKLPDGSPTPEAVRYVAGCMRQIKANMQEFTARNDKALGKRQHVERQPVVELDDAAD